MKKNGAPMGGTIRTFTYNVLIISDLCSFSKSQVSADPISSSIS